MSRKAWFSSSSNLINESFQNTLNILNASGFEESTSSMSTPDVKKCGSGSNTQMQRWLVLTSPSSQRSCSLVDAYGKGSAWAASGKLKNLQSDPRLTNL